MLDKSVKTIVVVDNNPANLSVISTILSDLNYRVIKANDGREGLRAVQQYKPDLVIIDKELPKLSSYELAEAIKDDSNLMHTPLISVIDSHYKFCDFDIYSDCLTKPFSKDILKSTVIDAIKGASLSLSKVVIQSSQTKH